MQTFVINLETAHLRRQHISTLLSDAGIAFEIFHAVTPADNPQRFFTGLNHRTLWLEALRTSISASEVACYASHILLWKKCKDLNEPVVILEDDVEPTGDITEAYAALEELTRTYGFIRLDPPWLRPNYFRGGSMTDPCTVVAARARSLCLIHPTYISLGSAAYAVSPTAARHLLKASLNRRLCCPLDNFFRRTWQHQQPMFYLEPASFRIDITIHESQISNRQISRSDYKFIRKLRKLPIRAYQAWARHASQRECARVRRLFSIDTLTSRSSTTNEPQGQLR